LALVPAASGLAGSASAVLGTAMVTYTGVLLGATAIPVWNQNVRLLPIHFAASGLGSAAALLTLLGHRDRALDDLAIGAAAAETLIGAAIEFREATAMAPLRHGPSGWTIRAGGVLSGPVPLLCRTVGRTRGWRRVASVCALAGSLLTRIGWIAAGRASAARS
jgi:hypothetical protein